METRAVKMVWHAISHDFLWKLGSLAVATVLWYAIVGEPQLITIQSVPVYYMNVPPDLELNPDAPANVRLQLRGPSGELGRQDLSGVRVLLNLSGVDSPGERMIALSNTNVNLPEGVSLERAEPAHIRVRLDRTTEQTSTEKGNQSTKR